MLLSNFIVSWECCNQSVRKKNDSTNKYIVDCITAQWNLYQLEGIPDESFMKEKVPHRVSIKYRTRLAGLVFHDLFIYC